VSKIVLWGKTIPLWFVNKGFCDFLSDPRYNKIFCSILTKAGAECKCPIKQGSYRVMNAETLIDLDAIPLPNAILRYGSGNWQLEIRAQKNYRSIGCFRIRTHTKMDL